MDIDALKKKFRGFYKGKKSYVLIFILGAAVLAVFFSSFQGSSAGEPDKNLNQGLEKKLEAALSRMQGVGEVSVVINYESSGEKIPAFSTDTSISEDGSNQKTEITSVSGGALILKERQPEIRGAVIVAKGAEDIGVRMSIISAATTLLGITADKVEVLY